MNKVSVIKDINTKSIYGAVVHDDHLKAVAIPVAIDSIEWAAWLNDSRASFHDVKSVLDTNLQQELSVDIDRHLVKSVEQEFGPELARKIELFIPGDKFIQDGKSHPTMGTSIVRKSLTKVPRTNLYSTPLNQINVKDRQAALNFKARRFRTEQKVTALNIQVKRVRAVFDANIGPGGGWRCPDGTLNGGQITDRFGRGCGGGLTRRIGRALMQAGQRLDEAGQARDSRRLARRVERATRRGERADRMREGRTRVANRLDAAADRLVGDFAPARPAGERRPSRTPSARRIEPRPTTPVPGGRRPQQGGRETPTIPGTEPRGLGVEILPGGERGRSWADMTDDELEAALQRNEPRKPPTDGTIGFLPESEAEVRRKRANQAAIRAEQERRRGGDGQEPEAAEAEAAPADGATPGRRPGRRPSQQRPVRPRRPQGERRPTPDADADRPAPSDSGDPFDFIEDPEERERVKEALGPWAKVLADLIRERRREEGRDGAPRPRRERRGAERGQESEEQRSLMQKIMDFFAQAIQRLGEFRERRGESRERRRARRDERRQRIADALDNAASRVLQEEGVPKRRRRGPARGGRRTDVNARARDAAERVVPDDDERSRWRNEVNKQWREERGIPEDLKELKDNELDAILEVVQNEENDFQANPDTFDMFVDERRRNLRRLNGEKRRRARASREEQPAPAAADGRQTPEAPAAPDSADLEGSVPDERSLRNVRNRFPRRGLPATAYWRDRDRPGYNKSNAQEMDRRFGRYYDRNGNINARGRYVNDRLRDEREANRRPLDADERERIETDANRNFDIENPDQAEAPGTANAPEAAPSRPGQLDGLSDQQILDRLRRFRAGDAEPFNMADLSNEEVVRLQNIIDNDNNNVLAEISVDGRRDLHPAVRLIGGEFNARQDDGRFNSDRPAATPEANVPPARPQLDTPEQRREFVDRALADNPQQPEDFGELVRMWKDAGNVAALEDAFNRYQARERALDRAEAQLRFAGHNTEADELRERRQTIGIARRQSLFALQSLNPEWGIEEVLNPPNERNADAPEFGPGSEPDERSFRNVFNAFRQRGLPAKPTWRDRNRRNYSETRERDFDRRFGRYYDANGDLNERGKYVNRKLREKREAEGRPLNEGEVAQVVVREEMENQERELASPAPVPDAAPAAAPGTPVNPSDPPDEALLQEARSGELARRMRERVKALKEASPGTSTPEDIGELVADIDRINRSLRQIRAQWIAGKNNGMQQQDLRNLERDHSALMMARNNAIPGFNRPFSSNDDTVVFVGDVGYVDGIFHEKFDGEREEFLRAHFAIFAGINDIIDEANGNDSQALSDVLNFVDAEWANNGGRMSPQEFASLMMKGGGWEGKSPAERSEIIRYAAAAAIDLDALDKAMIRKTGMTVDQAREINREREFITAQAARISTLRNQLNQRVVPGDLAPNVPDRVNELQAMATRYLDAVQHVRGIKRSIDARDDVPDEARAFAARLGRTMGGQPWPNTTGQQDIFSSDFAYLDTARPQEHINFVAAKLKDLMTGTSGGPADDEARIRQLQAIKADGVLRTLPQWRNTVLSGGVIGDNLGELVALAITRNNLTQTQIDMRIADLRRRSNLPTAPNANLGAQRNVNEPNGVVNGVDDVISSDSEAAELIDNILENAQRKRRRSLTSVFRKKYPNETGNPWDNYKRRNGGEHPFTASTMYDKLSRGTPEEKRKIKEWVKNLYEVEVEGPQGTSVRSVVADVRLDNSGITIYGKLVAKLADGREVTDNVGAFTRRIYTNGTISSSVFSVGHDSYATASTSDIDMITGQRVTRDGNVWKYRDGTPMPADHHITKGIGVATALNGHSWGWLKDAGFTKVEVGAASDGPYIWGRVGYRDGYSQRDLWNKAANEVLKFREGRSSIVQTEDQARMITELARRANAVRFDGRTSPSRMELIYALEHGGSDADRRARINAVKSWMRSNAPLSSGTLYLDQHSFDAIDESTDPQDVQLNRRGAGIHGGNMLRGLVRPQPPDERRGQIATPVVTPGDLPEPRVITNASIKSPEQAINFLRSGGSLSEVPNQFWIEAIKGNSSRTEVDPGSLFLEKPPRSGNRGDTRIFLMRDADGRATNQGIVIKGSVPARAGQGYMDDVYAEVASYNIAAAVGLVPEGAGYVGTASLASRSGRGAGVEEVMVVIPHAVNLAPSNSPLNAGAADYDPRILARTPDRGLPARASHFFHNFFLGAADRHAGNGGTFVDENGNAIVVPYDQGRVAVAAYGQQYAFLSPNAGMGTYAGKFRMDSRMFTEMQDHVRTLSRQQAVRFRREMLERYDEMVSRYRSVISGGRDEFIRRMSLGAPDTVGGRDVRSIREQRLGEIYDHLKVKVDRAAEHRNYLKTKLSIPRGAQ